ncbi:MAG: SseB family protein [Verrucomicrobiota bacterium]
MDKISLEQLQEMFAGLRKETPWDMDGEMLWGFFFISPSEEKLETVGEALEELEYEVDGVYKCEDEDSYILQAERVEKHTPESLGARNDELEALAAKLGVEYDGMDVNPVPSDDDFEFEEDEEDGAFSGAETIANPDLVAAIEALKSSNSEGADEALSVELQSAVYLVPYMTEQDPESADEGDEFVQLLVCADPEGAEYLPLFTDEESLRVWTKEQPVSAMAFNAEDAWDMVLSQADCSGAVVNPGGLALPIDRKLVELLKQGLDEADEE